MAFFAEVQSDKRPCVGRGAQAVPRTARQGARTHAAGHRVVHAERHESPQQRGRRRERLHASVRLGGAWLHVVPHCQAANAKLANGANGNADRLKTKLVTGRFFVERLLPETAAHLARIEAGANSTMELPVEAF